jgi:hypothetical protein
VATSRTCLAWAGVSVSLLSWAVVAGAETGAAAEKLSCTGAEIVSAGGCRLRDGGQGIEFLLSATSGSSINTLQIAPAGLSIDSRPVTIEIDGSATGADIADLDGNGWPEVYVYVTSAGSGSYGSLVAYAVNNGKSMSPVYLPPVAENPSSARVYSGHDTFAVEGNRLQRRFPLYRPGDTNAAPGGGIRLLQYRLEPGEASWQLVPDQVVDE